MNKEDVRRGYDGMRPTEEQKERMQQKVFAKTAVGRETLFQAGPVKSSLAGLIAPAAALLIVVTGAFLYLGFGGIESNTFTHGEANVQSDPLPSVPAPEDPSEINEEQLNLLNEETVVKEIVNKYRMAIQERWDMTRCERENISCLVMTYSAADALGYCLTDWNDDGIQELIISDGTVILDLYCIDGESVTHVICGTERNSYVLCRDYVIKNTASNGAAETWYNFYCLEGCRLKLMEYVRFSAYNSAENGIYCHGESGSDHHCDSKEHKWQYFTCNGKDVSEEEAWHCVNGYIHADMALTPIE